MTPARGLSVNLAAGFSQANSRSARKTGAVRGPRAARQPRSARLAPHGGHGAAHLSKARCVRRRAPCWAAARAATAPHHNTPHDAVLRSAATP